ncbi:MAG: type II toxin-antitoxin system RelE/ParE family toxin [Rhizobiaceae bacterium]
MTLMAVEIRVYEDKFGARPFDLWFRRLPDVHASKVDTVVARLAAGNRSGLKAVGAGVLERRIDWGPGLRVYLAFDGLRLILLLGGGSKSRQDADISAAKERWADYKQRKKLEE